MITRYILYEVIQVNLNIEPIGIIKASDSGLADVESSDHHQVQVSAVELVNRKGNLLIVKGITADNDSVIDVRLCN